MLTSLDIKIEALGTTSKGMPWITYTVKATGKRGSSFISKSKFFDAIVGLLAFKGQFLGAIAKIEASAKHAGVWILGEQGRVYLSMLEVCNFLSRWNRANVSKFSIRSFKDMLIVSSSSGEASARVTDKGCDCKDTFYHKGICKHSIAAYQHVRRSGWNSLSEYFTPVNWQTATDEQVFAAEAEARAALGF